MHQGAASNSTKTIVLVALCVLLAGAILYRAPVRSQSSLRNKRFVSRQLTDKGRLHRNTQQAQKFSLFDPANRDEYVDKRNSSSPSTGNFSLFDPEDKDEYEPDDDDVTSTDEPQVSQAHSHPLFFLGSQSILQNDWSSYRVGPFLNHSYTEEGFDMLTELREAASSAGLNQFKFRLSKRTCTSYQLSCGPNIFLSSLSELSKVPQIQSTFSDPRFAWYHLWVTSFNLPKIFRDNVTEDIWQAEYDEMYEWAVHMLTTYQGTNKSFFVGSSEGDSKLKWASGCRDNDGYNSKCLPTDSVIAHYIKWSNTRQQAIDDAKRDFPRDGVSLFHYIEFSLGDENYAKHPTIPGEAWPTILNSVVPAVNPDFLSFDSASRTNAYGDYFKDGFDLDTTDAALWSLLDFAESKLSETSTDMSVMGDLSKRVFIGEFGISRWKSSKRWEPTVCHIVRAALTWGCPFVLQWGLYDDNSQNQPLLSREESYPKSHGSLTQLYVDWHVEAYSFIEEYSPTLDSLRQWGVEWFSYRGGYQVKQQNVSSEVSSSFNQNFFIGSQSIYSKSWSSYRIAPFANHTYQETGFDLLTENREAAALIGMNQFKFKLSSSTCDDYMLRSCGLLIVESLTQLTQTVEVKSTFSDPRFLWYHLWVTTFNLPKMFQANLTEDVWQAEYDEMYEWATYMLATYQGTNKTFFVGGWEGDWMLMWASGCRTEEGSFDRSCIPTPEVVDIFIRWSNVRQKAIDDAKRDTPVEGVTIFHYIEFNLADENLEEHPTLSGEPRPTILNSVVPAVNPDFLSYSSYSRTNAYGDYFKKKFDQQATDDAFWALLNYAENKLSDTNTDMSVMGGLNRRVFIGEFGLGRNKAPESWAPTARHVFRASLTWGCPFVLQWELYDNDSKQQPLIARDATNQASFGSIMQLYSDWHEEASAFVEETSPSPEELRLWGVDWFSNEV